VALPATTTPPVTPADITYIFTQGGVVYLATRNGQLVPIAPATGAVGNVTAAAPAGSGLVGTRASAFDAATGTFYVNSIGATGSYFLSSVDVATGALGPVVGPLPATPNTGTGPGGARADQAVATLAVRAGGNFTLMEMRTSQEFPFIFMALLDPVTGASRELPLPDDWYKQWDIDAEVYPCVAPRAAPCCNCNPNKTKPAASKPTENNGQAARAASGIMTPSRALPGSSCTTSAARPTTATRTSPSSTWSGRAAAMARTTSTGTSRSSRLSRK
jgi:hypothetical protein